MPDIVNITPTHDAGCICRGNWRAIVAESEPLFGQMFEDQKGRLYHFFGVVHASEDYYYGMYSPEEGKLALLSCVGSIEGHGFTPVGDKVQTSA